MTDIIKDVYDFNKEAGLLTKPYDDFLESSFQIEEALEGFIETARLADRLRCKTSSPKDVSRGIVRAVGGDTQRLSDVARLDKACDAIVYALGSMAKLGLSPTQIQRALSIVTTANLSKIKCPKDEHGKLLKPANFDELYAPEPKLEALLAEIRTYH